MSDRLVLVSNFEGERIQHVNEVIVEILSASKMLESILHRQTAVSKITVAVNSNK